MITDVTLLDLLTKPFPMPRSSPVSFQTFPVAYLYGPPELALSPNGSEVALQDLHTYALLQQPQCQGKTSYARTCSPS